MIHSIIESFKGKAKSLHCSTDAVKAQAAFDKSSKGLVIWYRMNNGGGDVFARIDHEASAAQARQLKAAQEKAEADQKAAAEEAEATRLREIATTAAADAALEGKDPEGIADAVTAALEADAAPDKEKEKSISDEEDTSSDADSSQPKEPGEDPTLSDDPGSDGAAE